MNSNHQPVQTKWYRADDETIPVSWQQTQSDWTIHVNNHSYCCHQIVLGSGSHASNFFSSAFQQLAQFPGGKQETDLTQLIPEPCHGIWEMVLDFFYTSANFVINIENIVPIYKVAQILRVKALAHACVHWLEKHLDHNTSFTILAAAVS